MGRRRYLTSIGVLVAFAVLASPSEGSSRSLKEATDPARAAAFLKFDVLWKRASEEVARARCRRRGQRRLRCRVFSAYLDGDVVWRGRATITPYRVRRGSYRLRYRVRGRKKVCASGPSSCRTARFTWRGTGRILYPWTHD